ncbi:hypothetical protein LOZ53_005058 [Ophidiomyces ophidiicola]|nr:hypothetical protein LOZ53_005058 [Ophidiomyces ophidiicola]
MNPILLILLGFLQLASAHFRVDYPYWRGDSFSTQYTRPCGGVNVTNNRTEWPLDGGSIRFSPSHKWAFTYVNLAIGNDDTMIFNISLVPVFNQTGNGTFCFPKVKLPSGLSISAGTNASIQVIQASELGSSLYNCADITFTENARTLGNYQCQNSTNVGGVAIGGSMSMPSGTSPSKPTASGSSAAGSLASTSTWNAGIAAIVFGLIGNLL